MFTACMVLLPKYIYSRSTNITYIVTPSLTMLVSLCKRQILTIGDRRHNSELMFFGLRKFENLIIKVLPMAVGKYPFNIMSASVLTHSPFPSLVAMRLLSLCSNLCSSS